MNEIRAIASRPKDFICLEEIKKKVFQKVAEFSAEVCVSDEPIAYQDINYNDFKPIKGGQKWADHFGCGWFRLKGKLPKEAEGKRIVALLSIGGEGAVYNKGELIASITNVLGTMDFVQVARGKQMVDITSKSSGDEEIELLVDGGYNGLNGMFIYGGKLGRLTLNIFNEVAYRYYYDYLSLSLLLNTYKENEHFTLERKDLAIKLMKDSYKLLCQNEIDSAVNVIEEFYNKEKDYDDVEYTAIGHAHLDLAWLWPLRESKRKAVRTLTNACINLDKYPDFVFGMSQAAMSRWIENSNINLWNNIKQKVAENKIEIQGNMWTECDCNVPCGESLIRQFYYGDDYFINKFNANSNVVWLPDAFGFPATLPQIIKGVGKDYFMTIKLSWNKYNKFPLQTFNWVGTDGSKIITHIAPEGTYTSTASPLAIQKANKQNINKEVGKALLIYGVGDGGAGPGDGHYEIINRENKIYEINKIVKGSAQRFFEKLDSASLKDYKGELYLEKHQGTLTSQAKNKLYNRLIENQLHINEWLLALCGQDEKVLDEIWKEVLLYQFHDILPGSSINRVYKETSEGYNRIYTNLIDMQDNLINKLSSEKSLCAINPTSFEREEIIEYKNNWYKAVCSPYSVGKLISDSDSSLKVKNNNNIENEYYEISFGQNGEIIHMFDKKREFEITDGYFNEFLVYKDKKSHYDAWDIKKEYIGQIPKKPHLVSRSIETNDLTIVVSQSFVYDKSIIRQKIILAGNIVKFDNIVTWNEKHKMLRVNFSPSIYSDKAECDIQFGDILRSTKNETSIEQAQYEVCAHKYVSVSDEDGIFALFNDCKYGYYIKEGKISMNLLRSPKFPDKECDIGTHSFGFAIMVADNKQEIVKNAYCYNNPVIVRENLVKLPKLFEINANSVIIESIKPWYRGDGVVIRLYERYGNREEIVIKPLEKYNKVYEANLLEIKTTEVLDNKIKIAPYQIKTIIITK